MLQALARAFPCHLDESQRRHRRDLVPSVIAGKRLLQHVQNVVAVIGLLHVDEIDDDDSTQVPQPQLPRDCNCCLEICAVDGLLEIAMANIAPVLTSTVVIASV